MPILFDGSPMNNKKKEAVKPRLPGYERAKKPPGIKLTPRDRDIFLTLYRYDGVLSLDQVTRWFFGTSEGAKRSAQRRVSLLFHNGYLKRPTRQELYKIPEPIIWLDKPGAEVVAGHLDVGVDELGWRDTPRWSQAEHDICLNEFRHMVEVAAANNTQCAIEVWHGQDELRQMFTQPVAYLNHNQESQQKLVWPDGYFRLVMNQAEGTLRLPYLVEFDNGTEDNSRFARDKVSPNIHLVVSNMYEQQIGQKGGRFLVVVSGSQTRFENMRRSVTQAGGAAFFLFARLETLAPGNVLAEPVWFLPHQSHQVSLAEYGSAEFQNWLRNTTKDLPGLSLLRS